MTFNFFISYKHFQDIKEPINENTSYDFNLSDFIQTDSSTLTITNVKVYVFVTGDYDPPKYINGRNGTNNTGLTLQNNIVSFHMSPADNSISLIDVKNYYETHTVRFEVFYNSEDDKFYVEFELKIRNLEIVS